MRREVILRATKQLELDIESSGVDKMFDSAFERARVGKSDDRDIVSFSVFRKLAVAAAKYTEVEHAIAKILGLAPLFDSEYWQRFSQSPDPAMLFEMQREINFAKAELPRIIALFQQDHVEAAKSGVEKLPKELLGKSAITFILPEDEGEYSSPSRLIAALEAVTNIYGVTCTLANHSESDLIVLAIDSGSDKSFDFLGLAKIMEEVRKLVIAVWDRRVFYRHMQISQCISLIAQSLPVIEKIEALKRSKAIEPEQAELLKRRTILGVTQFLESGIYIDEMNIEGRQSPRLLMRPEQKLLAAPNPIGSTADRPHADESEDASAGGDVRQSDGLTDEDIAHLERLLEKAKPKKSTDSAAPTNRPPRKGRKDS